VKGVVCSLLLVMFVKSRQTFARRWEIINKYKIMMEKPLRRLSNMRNITRKTEQPLN
jgi:hypothetical protein